MGNTIQREVGFEVEDRLDINLEDMLEIQPKALPLQKLNDSLLESEDLQPSVNFKLKQIRKESDDIKKTENIFNYEDNKSDFQIDNIKNDSNDYNDQYKEEYQQDVSEIKNIEEDKEKSLSFIKDELSQNIEENKKNEISDNIIHIEENKDDINENNLDDNNYILKNSNTNANNANKKRRTFLSDFYRPSHPQIILRDTPIDEIKDPLDLDIN